MYHGNGKDCNIIIETNILPQNINYDLTNYNVGNTVSVFYFVSTTSNSWVLFALYGITTVMIYLLFYICFVEVINFYPAYYDTTCSCSIYQSSIIMDFDDGGYSNYVLSDLLLLTGITT